MSTFQSIALSIVAGLQMRRAISNPKALAEQIDAALRIDSRHQVYTAEFWNTERVIRLLDGNAAMAIQESVKLLYPRTWKLIEGTKPK